MKSLVDITHPIQHTNIIRHLISDDGTFPNNSHIALLVYRNALRKDAKGTADLVEQLFESNGWSNAWKDGVYDYHHYHSNTHEVLAIIDGSARIQFGGPNGISLLVETGDVVIIPAGVAHKNLGGEENFLCVGAYPDGNKYDINLGKADERPAADDRIKNVPIPESDPVFGMNGPLNKEWINDPTQLHETL